MDTNASIFLKFSQEELCYLMSLMQTGTLPGMGEDPLSRYSEAERPAILRAGFNSLQARGMLQYDVPSKKVSLDTLLLAIISTCSNPQATLYISRIPVDAPPTIVYYHQKKQFFVGHLMETGQIHGMKAFFDADTAHIAIASEIFTTPQPPANSISIEISEESFNAILRLVADDNLTEALEASKKAGLGAEISAKLVECLQTMSANSMLATVRFAENTRQVDQGQMIAWIESPQGDFRIETRENEGDKQRIVSLTPFNRQVIQDAITNWLQSPI